MTSSTSPIRDRSCKTCQAAAMQCCHNTMWWRTPDKHVLRLLPLVFDEVSHSKLKKWKCVKIIKIREFQHFFWKNTKNALLHAGKCVHELPEGLTKIPPIFVLFSRPPPPQTWPEFWSSIFTVLWVFGVFGVLMISWIVKPCSPPPPKTGTRHNLVCTFRVCATLAFWRKCVLHHVNKLTSCLHHAHHSPWWIVKYFL